MARNPNEIYSVSCCNATKYGKARGGEYWAHRHWLFFKLLHCGFRHMPSPHPVHLLLRSIVLQQPCFSFLLRSGALWSVWCNLLRPRRVKPCVDPRADSGLERYVNKRSCWRHGFCTPCSRRIRPSEMLHREQLHMQWQLGKQFWQVSAVMTLFLCVVQLNSENCLALLHQDSEHLGSLLSWASLGIC